MAMDMRPDVIVMDINMPGMDGIAAAEIISQRLPNSPVIMMSVHGEAEHLKRSMLAGAREFLVKPFSADEFSTSIKRVHERELVRREQIQATRDAGDAVGRRRSRQRRRGPPGRRRLLAEGRGRADDARDEPGAGHPAARPISGWPSSTPTSSSATSGSC